MMILRHVPRLVRRACATAALVFAASLAWAMPPASDASAADLSALSDPAARRALQDYLAAISSGRYDRAFGALTGDEQRYFQTPANYGSIFLADQVTLERFHIAGATVTDRGIVVSVDETTAYFDLAHHSKNEVEGSVLYGLVRERGAYRIKDPYHPWRALAVDRPGASSDGVTATIGKISFFTGRVEVVVEFTNRGDKPVTILPNRTILRDDRGNILHCITDPSAPYTDREIRLGLRLAAGARYTGGLAFSSIDRYRPGALALTVGPLLQDEGDLPFSIDVPAVPIPH